MTSSRWTAADIPSQDGRTVVITGANSGLGLVTARERARAGAHVVMACRNVTKGEAAAADLTGSVEVRPLDLADLASVRAFVAELDGPVDVLVNNVANLAVAQSADAGALPSLYAATVVDLPGGSYIGPDGISGSRGHPRPVGSSGASHDRAVQRALWERSEELTGVHFDIVETSS